MPKGGKAQLVKKIGIHRRDAEFTELKFMLIKGSGYSASAALPHEFCSATMQVVWPSESLCGRRKLSQTASVLFKRR